MIFLKIPQKATFAIKYKSLTIFANRSILDVWLGYKKNFATALFQVNIKITLWLVIYL